MKRRNGFYDQQPDWQADYKMEFLNNQDEANYESTDKWIYLGADALDKRYAKVGLTFGDISTRSYSSANPNYYIFCAFKCRHDIKKEQIADIEKSVLEHMDAMFTHTDGSTKRVRHYESRRLSECYYDIEFEQFFYSMHQFLFKNHSRFFIIGSLDEEIASFDGSYLDCEFDRHLSLKETFKYINLILQ